MVSLVEERVVNVEPIYGWGWSDSRLEGTTIETPSNFEIRAAASAGAVLEGVVSSLGHPYFGARVNMSQRHTNGTAA